MPNEQMKTDILFKTKSGGKINPAWDGRQGCGFYAEDKGLGSVMIEMTLEETLALRDRIAEIAEQIESDLARRPVTGHVATQRERDIDHRLTALRAALRTNEPLTDRNGPTAQGNIISAITKLERERALVMTRKKL